MSSAPTANGICSIAISPAPRHGILSRLFGYCLMSNHFHLLLKPAPGQSISRILQSLTVAHTWRHHRRQGTSGHVWQGHFRSPVVQDGDHLLVVLRYIEANPVRAAMEADPCEYTWSSHRCHGAGHADPILDSFPEWEQLGRTKPERRVRWRRKVRGEQPAKELDGVRSSVAVAGPTVQRTGSRSFPIASASSVSRALVVVRLAKRCSPGRPGWSPTQAPHKSVLAQLTHTAPHFNLRDPLSVVVSWTRPRVPMHPPCFPPTVS